MRKAAALCPLREKSGQLEVLLTKRSFWNPKRNKQMSFPGEWVFPGGNYEPDDKNLSSTAIREFKEEVGYKGDVSQFIFLRTGQTIAYEIEFYAASIDSEMIKGYSQEVMEIKWKTPQAWLEMICSEEFTSQQLEDLKHYGKPLRNMPIQTIETLGNLQLLQDTFRFLKYLNSIYGGN